MTTEMPRTYDNSRRSRLAAETTERIAETTEILLGSRPIGEVTLQVIADGAGVSIQTVLRHYGSREGCIEAAGKRMLARIDGQRGQTHPGEIDSALVALLDHYESEGRLILHLLAQEEMDVTARSAVQQGRSYHRDWVQRVFGPCIPSPDQEVIDALVAATDLYIWKLLRLDLGRSKEETLSVFHRLVQSTLVTP